MSAARFNSNQQNDHTTSNLTENFCLIGTPLPPLDSKKADPNELQPIWKQEVRDEQGRQRFHGAFTGGYSAGYFNTVGSKEGWTPSTFISSRSKKKAEASKSSVSGSAQRPEDFMDEEDLDDLREKRELKNTAAYQYEGISGERADDSGAQDREEDPLSTLLKSNSKAPLQSIGVSILKRMGWKEGHGLGPKLTFSKRNKLLKLLGMRTYSREDMPESATSGHKEKAIFPPPDTKTPDSGSLNERKRDDLHGLGWVGNETLEMALKRVRSKDQGSEQTGKDGGDSRGLDLDEEEGEESSFTKSIGVYAEADDIRNSTLNFSNRERLALGVPEESRLKPNLSDGRGEIDLSRGNRWKDGREVLKGFKVSVRSQVADEWWVLLRWSGFSSTKLGGAEQIDVSRGWRAQADVQRTSLPSSVAFSSRLHPRHEPPPIPQGWKPDPARVWNTVRDQNSHLASGSSLPVNLGPEQRAGLLGEARIPGPPPALKDYITKPISSSVQNTNSSKPAAVSATPSTLEEPAIIPSLDSSVASSALKGFLPFSNDQAKQKRYLDFLKSNVPGSGIESPIKGNEQTNDQFQRELEDFVKMARVFKPMSIAMSNRFTSSSSNESLGNGKTGREDSDSLGDLPKSGLYQPIFKADEDERKNKRRRIFETEEEKNLREEKEQADSLDRLNPAQRAAREGRFGKETRTVMSWYPNKLLCKRFNVPDPHPDHARKANEDDMSCSVGNPGNLGSDPISTSFPGSFSGRSGKPRERGQTFDAEMGQPKADELWNSKRSEIKEMVQDQAWKRFSSQDSSAFSHPSVPSSPEPDRSKVEAQGAPMSLENVGLGEDETQGKDTLDYVKPSMDIFKAVFGDDSDVSDEEQDSDAVDGAQETNQALQNKETSSHIQQHQMTTKQAVGERETKEENSKLIFKPKTQRSSNNEKNNQASSLPDVPGSELEIEKALIQEQSKSKGKGKGKADKGGKKKSVGKGMLTFNVDDDESSSTPSFKLEKRKLNKDQGGDRDRGGEKKEDTKDGNRSKRQKASDLF